MIAVIVNKRLNRHVPRNKVVHIQEKDLEIFGIGKDLVVPHQMEVEIDGSKQFIPNSFLDPIAQN